MAVYTDSAYISGMDEYCEHGHDGFCMLCVREGENKPTGQEDDKDKPYEGPRFAGDEVYGYGDWTG